jgi:hypothetical protein
MKHIIWLSPSLAAGAIAARLVVFFERRRQIRGRRGLQRAVAAMRRRLPAPSPAEDSRWAPTKSQVTESDWRSTPDHDPKERPSCR